MNEQSELLRLAKRVQALSENGLHYTESDFDRDRYTELDDNLHEDALPSNRHTIGNH